ncbi:MAG: hypothetical protein C4519_14640 [Desulfobacteraceae bacterium]|nr:MAG: hypothetical protein C4519_14640 [Desulfobacteraceae bacterium]
MSQDLGIAAKQDVLKLYRIKALPPVPTMTAQPFNLFCRVLRSVRFKGEKTTGIAAGVLPIKVADPLNFMNRPVPFGPVVACIQIFTGVNKKRHDARRLSPLVGRDTAAGSPVIIIIVDIIAKRRNIHLALKLLLTWAARE